MPVKDLLKAIQYPEWAGLRYCKLDGFQRFLEGKAYDHLKIPFHQEKESSGQYIPLRERRPSVVYNLPQIIVSRTSRLLFGGKRFPKFVTSNEEINKYLQRIVDTSNLQQAMVEAARVGSIGSVAIVFYVKDDKFFFDIINPKFCQPVFAPNRDLDSLLIMYPVFGYDLVAVGYQIDDEDINEEFMFAKKLTATEEICYHPIKTDDFNGVSDLKKDSDRSTQHKLGIVPAVWVKNLPPTNRVDGACTFELILPLCMEIDYQLSQCGRGLKYNADPQLLIKEADSGSDETAVRGTANTLFVGEKGDAKLLEIDGAGQKAVIEFVKLIRQYALEVASSSRKDPETSYGNMSGRAMEILDADLIGIVSELRLTYGEEALKCLVHKILLASNALELFKVNPKDDKTFNIELYWGNWFEPTPVDLVQIETALDMAVQGRRMFQHEARAVTATTWNIGNEDPHKMEEQWQIPPEPPLKPADRIALEKAKATPGDDGREPSRSSG